jgi:vacuolar-type H+-ATPase subunit H
MSRNSAVQPPAGDLTRLLDTERWLAERLQAARSEAEALLARARSDVEQREATLAAELESDQRSMADRLLGERGKREQEIADAAQRQVSAYVDVSDERLTAIARALTRRLLDDESDS